MLGLYVDYRFLGGGHRIRSDPSTYTWYMCTNRSSYVQQATLNTHGTRDRVAVPFPASFQDGIEY